MSAARAIAGAGILVYGPIVGAALWALLALIAWLFLR